MTINYFMLKEILLFFFVAISSTETLTETEYEQLKQLEEAPKFSFDGMWFLGKIIKVYDGDSYHIILNVDDSFSKFSLRAVNIDTPETRGSLKEFGKEVGMNVREMIVEKIVHVQCGKFDKYGRLLATVYTCTEDGSLVNFNDQLVNEKMAKHYDGGTKSVFTQEDYDAYLEHMQNNQLPTFVDCLNQKAS